MSKLPLGIIAMLGVGIGAFVLSKRSKDPIETQQPPVITTPVITPAPVAQTPVIEDPIIVAPIIREERLTISSIDVFGFSGQLDIDETIKFFGNISSVGIVTYDWDFGDGKISSGTDKQYTTHSYPNEGEYKVILKITNNFGETMTKSKTIFVIPKPLTESDISIEILNHVNSAVIRLTNNYIRDINGNFSLKLKGATQKSFSGSTFIKSNDYTDITVESLVSGQTGFEFELRVNGIVLTKNKDMFIDTTYIEQPTQEDLGYCTIPQDIRDVITQLNTSLIAPEWFMKYDVDYIQTCQISKEQFMATFNSLLSKGDIRARI